MCVYYCGVCAMRCVWYVCSVVVCVCVWWWCECVYGGGMYGGGVSVCMVVV